MKKAPIPENDKLRIDALKRFQILDTEAEKEFDDIVMIAANLCQTKIALISLIDLERQWFKANYGLAAKETPRDVSYCGHAIMSDEPLIVEDASLDERFCDNPLLTGEPHVRFYVGIPLVTEDGFRLGTLCVIDHEPKKITEEQLTALKALARNVMALLIQRVKNLELVKTKEQLQEVERMASAGGWELYIETNEVKWTDEVYRIYGIELGTPTSKIDGLKNYTTESREKLEVLLSKCIEDRLPFDGTFEFVDNNGEKKWVRSVGRAVVESDRVVKLVGTFQDVTQYINNEVKLVEVNKYLDLSLDSANLGIWDWNLETNSVLYDSRWARMLGYELNEIEPSIESWESRVHPEDLEAAQNDIRRYLEGKTEKYRNIHRMRNKQGEWVYILDQGVVSLRDESGRPLRFTGTHSDITSLKKKEVIETAIEDLRERYITFNDDHQSFYEYCLKTLLEACDCSKGILGYYPISAADERYVYSVGLSDFTSNQEMMEEMLGKIIAHGDHYLSDYSTENEILIPGAEDFIAFTIHRDELRSLYILIASDEKKFDLDYYEYLYPLIQAITEMIAYLKLEEYKNDKDYERKIILESTGVALWSYYPVERRLELDDSMYNLWGYSKGDYENDIVAWESTMHPEDKDKALQEFIEMIKYKDHYETSFRIITKSGTLKFIKAKADVVRDMNGKAIKVLGVNWDSTNDVIIQKELVIAKEMAEASEEAKSEFLANMSHEIRTPMNGILGMISLLSESDLTKEQMDMLETIQSSGDILMTILNDILDISKLDAGKYELDIRDFDIRNCIENTTFLFSTLASEKGINLTSTISSVVPLFLKGDVTRIRQILVNFLSNAIKFTERGEVKIEVGAIKKSDRDVSLVISVIDTGIGIHSDAQENIFEAFSQADSSTTRVYGGTGLGLSICSKLIEIMDGEVKLESEPGKGTNITFSLPLEIGVESDDIRVEDELLKNQDDDKFSELNPHTILLVEDNKVNQKIASALLAKLGYLCDIAENGQEGVEMACSKDYSIVFMDMQMPVMDGLKATEEIIKSLGDKAPPIVAMTANVLDDDRIKCFEVGMVDYISKPVKKEDIKKVLISRYR
ncbi:putative histidine kinase/response regulator fusion protein [Halobacteriovorax marinus SJ]|uniref:Sensory/regulatory protein RpfC n=1 Tax=Halobacteriovorax marinus (strain ATCC BAA-682 / DSM 15412 / SJ) TaxID=862908 RepID=E1X0E6_HALMS|nr:PAS domain-containing protein [Halobacteriovorax marinus]CBW26374.1 putative histidine kinase/response regulator fusion protein [Halobacteriovorax marinus SJ]